LEIMIHFNRDSLLAKKHLFETYIFVTFIYVLFMCWWWVLSQKK